MYSCIHTGTHGPTCLFRANLAPFSLQRIQAALAAAAAEGADPLMLQYRQPVDFLGARLGLGRGVALHYLLIRSIPDSLTYSVSLLLQRQCDRTLGAPEPCGDAHGPTGRGGYVPVAFPTVNRVCAVVLA
jgi:hypothetical protein